jgi:hypothetical protein
MFARRTPIRLGIGLLRMGSRQSSVFIQVAILEYAERRGETAVAYYTDAKSEPPAVWWCPGSWIAKDGGQALALSVTRLSQGRHPKSGRQIVAGIGDKKRAAIRRPDRPPRCLGRKCGYASTTRLFGRRASVPIGWGRGCERVEGRVLALEGKRANHTSHILRALDEHEGEFGISGCVSPQPRLV